MSDHDIPEPDADDAADPAPLDPAVAARLAVEPLDELTRRRLRAAALEAFDDADGSGRADPHETGAGGPGEIAALRPRRTLMWLAPVAAAAAALALVVAVNTAGNDTDRPVATAAADRRAKQDAATESGGRAFSGDTIEGRSIDPGSPPSTEAPNGEITPDGSTETEPPPDGASSQTLPDLGEVSDPSELQGAIDEVQPPDRPQNQRPTTTTTSVAPDGTGVGVQDVPLDGGVCRELLGDAVVLLEAQGTYDGREAVIYVIADPAAAASAEQTTGIAIVVALDTCEVLSREPVDLGR